MKKVWQKPILETLDVDMTLAGGSSGPCDCYLTNPKGTDPCTRAS